MSGVRQTQKKMADINAEASEMPALPHSDNEETRVEEAEDGDLRAHERVKSLQGQALEKFTKSQKQRLATLSSL